MKYLRYDGMEQQILPDRRNVKLTKESDYDMLLPLLGSDYM